MLAKRALSTLRRASSSAAGGDPSRHLLSLAKRAKLAGIPPEPAAAAVRWAAAPPPLVGRCVARALEERNYSFLFHAARLGGADGSVVAALDELRNHPGESDAAASDRDCAADGEVAIVAAAAAAAAAATAASSSSSPAMLAHIVSPSAGGSPFSARGSVARADAATAAAYSAASSFSERGLGGSSSNNTSSDDHSARASTAAPSVRPLRPGEYAPRTADPELESMLRVDHAGERGAVRIYDGQLAVTRDPEARRQIERMREQEVEHLRNLERLLPRRRTRPTLLVPLWDAAGFALGAATAALGPRAAMACTVAVEEAITEHYNDQLRTLHQPEYAGREEELRHLIRHNRDEEMEHRDTGLKEGAEQAPFYSLLTSVIRAGCHAAIWVAKKV